jgi:hypothetical protein
LHEDPEKVLLEIGRLKPKQQWRAQDFGDARSTKHLPRKVTDIELSHPKREAMVGLQMARP